MGKLDVRVPAPAALPWDPAAAHTAPKLLPRWTDSELHCTFLTLDSIVPHAVPLVTGRSMFQFMKALGLSQVGTHAMVEIGRWGPFLFFSELPRLSGTENEGCVTEEMESWLLLPCLWQPLPDACRGWREGKGEILSSMPLIDT